MLHKDKWILSPNKLKFISSLAVSGVIMLLVFILTSIVLNQALKASEKRYLDNCAQVLQGYSSGIYYYLENYHTSISSIYNKDLFEEENPQKIQKWIAQNLPFLSEDFFSVFYVDSEFNGFFSQGNIIDLRNKPYISADNFNDTNYYVSDIYYTDYSSTPVFFIEEPYFDANNKLKGILCASIKINELSKITSDIKIGENSTAYILDRQEKVLTHPDPDYIGKIFIPKNKKYKKTTSDVTAREGNGYVETENHLGEPIDLFYAKIKNCGWTLSVGFPKKYFDDIHWRYSRIKFLILFISIIALIGLLCIEMTVSNYFYKNQLIEPVYDPLTKLWTRQKFERSAEKLIKKNTKAKYMMIEADIRGFKFINQNYREDVADKMIYFFSALLNQIALEYKGYIGRGYADHFYLFFRINNVAEAMNIFKGRLYLVNEQIRNYEIPFIPKFGITFCKPIYHPDITIKDLVGQASFAKSTMKDSMLSPYAIYNAHLLSQINDEQKIEQRMKTALENQEFFIMYQPKVLLSDESVVGAEALVRWQNPDFGMIYPDKFIPLFERNGFIVKLDFYVYDKVFSFLDSQIKAGNPVVPISVNMSRNHNQPEKFMFEFMRIFRQYAIPPYLIQVEILERSVMDRDTLREITDELHKEGFSVAMDDFGSGESSLNMLTEIPVDVLKFDREFLKASFNSQGFMEEKSATFIRSLIDLSKNLDKETVFEGVETQSQRDFLRSINCDQVQGYFYSQPLMEEDFLSFIRARSKDKK